MLRWMSQLECIEVFAKVDIPHYLEVLQNEFGARPHPQEAESFLIDDPGIPFRRPRQFERHLSILGFNYAPLSSWLILALIDHPELAPPETIVRWTAEQEVVAQGALAELASLFGERPEDLS